MSGLNLDNLVNVLKNRGITLSDVKKTDGKTLRLSVNYADNAKFFAITRELCYNVKRIGEKGRWRFALSLCRNAGIAIGAIIFALFCIVADDYIFSVEYYGSGKKVSREIDAYLKSRGISAYSRFSDIDLKTLSDDILSVSDKISFAECVKSGNRLKINLALARTPEKAFGGRADTLVSDVDGEIEYLRIYRGTALKTAGDKVFSGEEICSGKAVIKETEVDVGVIATCAIKAEYFYEYESEKSDDEDAAEIFARVAFGEGEILSTAVEKVKPEPEREFYVYKIKIVYRRILYT